MSCPTRLGPRSCFWGYSHSDELELGFSHSLRCHWHFIFLVDEWLGGSIRARLCAPTEHVWRFAPRLHRKIYRRAHVCGGHLALCCDLVSSNHLLAGAVLCSSTCTSPRKQRTFRPPAKLGALALILTLPIILFSATFLSESDEVHAQLSKFCLSIVSHTTQTLPIGLRYRSCARLGLMIAGYRCVRKPNSERLWLGCSSRSFWGRCFKSPRRAPSCASLPMAFISALGTYLECNLAYRVLMFVYAGFVCSTETITTKKMGTHRYDGYCVGRRIDRISI